MKLINNKISKFIFFYSDIYEYYNKHININISKVFNIEAIKINDIKTKERDKNGRGGHTFIGETIKIELVIDKIKENMNDYIIFSDATIFINNTKTQELYNFFCNYLSYDLCFVDEGKDNHVKIIM